MANKQGVIADSSQAIQGTAKLPVNYLSAVNYLPGPAMEEKLLPNLCLMNGLAGGDSPGDDSALSQLLLPAASAG